MPYAKLSLLIDGKWIDRTAASLPVIDPSNEDIIGHLPLAGIGELDAALGAADRAFRVWRNVNPAERARILHEAARHVRNRAAAIARLLTIEQGKPLAQALAEVLSNADFLDWIGQEGRRTYGRLIPAGPGRRWSVVKEPVGPVAAFSPWNFPATATVRKFGAAIAAGCSCIIKPSEETPATCLAFAQALVDAGLPAGVLNVVFGEPDRVARHLLASPIIRKLTFTGSIPIGKHLARLAADGMKRVTMELGGHAPVVVFDDADVERAVDLLVPYKFRNAGQVCVSPTRFFVQRSVHRKFADAFATRASTLKVGNGLDIDVDMGPLANRRRLDAVEAFVEDALAHGAKLLAGGKRVGNKGFFFQPTVLDEVPESARIMSEEPFGPIAPITPFDSLDEVVERANRLPFGLAAYAFSTSADRTAMIGSALEAGMVAINNIVVNANELPFGGVKESGYGSEAGSEGIEPFLVTKMISEAWRHAEMS